MTKRTAVYRRKSDEKQSASSLDDQLRICRGLAIGRYPVLSLADARAKATEALLTINEGADPALVEQAVDDPTYQFDAVATSFVTRHCNVRNKASTAKETDRLLNKHFVSAWKKRDVQDIRQSHINEILDALVADGNGRLPPCRSGHALLAGEGPATGATRRVSPPMRRCRAAWPA